MRILWICYQPTKGATGVEVFDRRTTAALRAMGHVVDLLHPVQVGRMRELANMVSGLPHYRTRFASAANLVSIAERSALYDVVICSWEPFDVLVAKLDRPSIMILHNITSRALPEIFAQHPLARLGALQARAWERKLYRSNRFAALAVLSKRDFEYLSELRNTPRILLVPPGMPPCTLLADDARLLPEIVVSGTYEWVPKYRDIVSFAREYGPVDQRLTICADNLPAEAAAILKPQAAPSAQANKGALRFGLVSDRFEAGHKLKTMSYIADNQIVLSFADIDFDFDHIPDHAFFIRKLGSVADIRRHVDEVAALPAEALRYRFRAFQSACAANFTWEKVAATLIDAACSMQAVHLTTATVRDDAVVG